MRRLARMGLAVIVLYALGAACVEVTQGPKAKDALDVKDVKVSDGMGLQTACVPTGVEMCFDALDNNCNGIIDEGCGLHTGVLQFTIAWSQPEADVDLNVVGPEGKLAGLDEPNDDGLIKDKDCPGSDNQCYGQNIENVYLAEGKPRKGRYRVVIRLEELRDARPPIKVRMSARIGQRHFSSVVELKERAEEREFVFSL